jgi:hypothetical protein
MIIPDDALDAAIRKLTEERGIESSVGPSEIARLLSTRAGADEWQELLRPVRRAAVRLALNGEVVILRKGRPVDPATFRGVYRIGVPDTAGENAYGVSDLADEPVPESVPEWSEASPFSPPPDDYDPDLDRAPRPGTMPDIAAALENYLAAELDDAPGGDAEIGDDIVGLPGEQDEETVLPGGHRTLRRDFEGPPTDEE